jgi:2-hydroxychromene-2-carboxylate isomerase
MIEFFFDCSSPWTYLAFHNIQLLAHELGEAITWRPILVGGIFNSVNPSVYESRQRPVPAKRDYMLKDLQDWAHFSDLEIRFPPSIFPINSVKAMRACIVLDGQQQLVPFACAVFQAYWGRDQDITQDAALAGICASLQIDDKKLLAQIEQPSVKHQLRANTEELMARGGFGSPTIFVNRTDMYFGNDRLPLVRDALLRLRRTA